MSELNEIEDNGSDMSNSSVDTALNELKEMATTLKIQFHPSIGIDKLRDKVNAVLRDTPSNEEQAVVTVTQVKKELSREEKIQIARDEALKLIRVIVSCMNPAKQLWEGQQVTIANRGIGKVSKYIPFNNDAGWHVPKCLVDQLQAAQCPAFYTHTDSRTGMKMRRSRLIKEFNVVILPDLTLKELEDLSMQQKLNNSIDPE